VTFYNQGDINLGGTIDKSNTETERFSAQLFVLYNQLIVVVVVATALGRGPNDPTVYAKLSESTTTLVRICSATCRRQGVHLTTAGVPKPSRLCSLSGLVSFIEP
jgi:hypothetical protein